MIRVAVGTASILGLTAIKMKVKPSTAHLLIPGKCIYDCAFCTQGKSSKADQKLLSRISWPEFEETEVYSALGKKQSHFQRVCLQVVHTEDKNEHLRFLKEIRSKVDIPLSVDLKADDIKQVRQTFSEGADVVGLPLDCASSSVYSQVKDGLFAKQFDLIKEGAGEFPNKISTHIIIGLGESEQDVVSLLRKLYDMKVTSGLFAFTPIKGTLLENKEPPKEDNFRRMQMARFLIYNGFYPDMEFDSNGKIVDFGYESQDLFENVSASAFQTTGCSGCNRPYYNEKPGGIMYNYPRILTSLERKNAISCALNQKEGASG
jgi:biotin synthase